MRLGRTVLEDAPESLAELWPAAVAIPVELQRQFREGTFRLPGRGGVELPEPPGDAVMDAWAASHPPSASNWDARLLDLGEALLQDPEEQSVPRTEFMLVAMLELVMGSEVYRVFASRQDCGVYALLAAARALELLPFPPPPPADPWLDDARRRYQARLMLRRKETSDAAPESVALRLLLHRKLVAPHMVEAVRARWFKT
jgi:hypothetical protein